MHRRERYHRQIEMLSDAGHDWSIDDAITENLALPELLRDYMSQLNGTAECEAAFAVLRSLTVCDPTVGSGAFLFAAINALEPLYSEVLARAEELESEGRGAPEFLADARKHPSPRYWLIKTICLHNLYGVDLMQEAPEIAKLRLFLKLAAQIERVEDLEPLPDLDFNIKCGNLLVGIADDRDAAERLFSQRLDHVSQLQQVEDTAKQIAEAFDDYIAAEAADTGHLDHTDAKQTLRSELQVARNLADTLLHEMRDETEDFEAWRRSHQPFHWFVEFPSVWRSGGFDVIIGNPPYIDPDEVTEYNWIGYRTQHSPNLFAPCVERASKFLNDSGRISMIVMHAVCFNKGYLSLRHYLSEHLKSLWISSYDKRPDSLFAGSAQVRNSIVIGNRQGSIGLRTSRCHRWPSERRTTLFPGVSYTSPNQSLMRCGDVEQWPFVDSLAVSEAFTKLVSNNDRLDGAFDSSSQTSLVFKKVAYAFLSAYQDPPPIVTPSGTRTTSPHGGLLCFASEECRDAALMVIASRWAFLWWCMYGDSFNVTKGTLAAFPAGIDRLVSPGIASSLISDARRLLSLAADLKAEMPQNLTWQTNAGVRVGRYNMIKCRHITDEADLVLARLWGIQDAHEAAGNLRDRMIFGNRE